MSDEAKPSVEKLSRDEVVRRLKRFRDGLEMSRREFGEVQQIVQRGELVIIYTDKHTIRIPRQLWEDLAIVGEQAAADAKAKKNGKAA